MTARKEMWPVYKGASFFLWEPDSGTYYASAQAERIATHLYNKRQSQHATASSAFSELDPVVVADRDTLPCLRPRIAFRDVTRATDTRTIIAALVPGRLVLTHQAPYLLRIAGTTRHEAFVLGILSSMVLDWYARRIVEIHLTFHLLNSLPIPNVDLETDPVGQRVVEISGRLAAVDERFAEWAAEVGVPIGSATDPDVKRDLVQELDACVALLYGLDEADLGVLYTTFDEVRADFYNEHHAAVLKHFRKWKRRMADAGGAAGGGT